MSIHDRVHDYEYHSETDREQDPGATSSPESGTAATGHRAHESDFAEAARSESTSEPSVGPGAERQGAMELPDDADRARPAPATDGPERPQDGVTHTDAPMAVTVEASRSTADMSGETSMFGHDELAELRARWDHVQASFVDDPRDCVREADGLVSAVFEQLTAGFAQARAGIEEQWGRGEEPSTEQLRVALRRYRDFFERLLAI